MDRDLFIRMLMVRERKTMKGCALRLVEYLQMTKFNEQSRRQNFALISVEGLLRLRDPIQKLVWAWKTRVISSDHRATGKVRIQLAKTLTSGKIGQSGEPRF